MAVTINGTTGISGVDGSASTPAVQGTDTNTGIFYPAADTVGVATGGSERVRVDSSGQVGIGTSSPDALLTVNGVGAFGDGTASAPSISNTGDLNTGVFYPAADTVAFSTGGTERMRVTSAGVVLVGKTSSSLTTAGFVLLPDAENEFSVWITNDRSGGETVIINRQATDGTLIQFRQANTTEGDISVSGTTVSYNGGHLSRYAQTQTAKDESLLKGTVLSNLDEMNVYTNAEGNLVENEQLNKVKVSNVEGDVNVAGVFVNWTYDEDHQVDEINMAMTGDMIIRIAQGVVVQKGDLLMSAGDGTAKPQGDDIVRSKTVAKVTSNHVTCTYEDGSYCVPCVLMAC